MNYIKKRHDGNCEAERIFKSIQVQKILFARHLKMEIKIEIMGE